MQIMYYMPLFLAKTADHRQDTDLLDFCELFKIVNVNASIIDRTNTIPTPFRYLNMYPVPKCHSVTYSFDDLCIDRAHAILAEGKKVHLLYSGGLDSSCVALAFYHACRNTGTFDQVVISATPPSVNENPKLWECYLRPNFAIESSLHTLRDCDLHDRYVQGENADQMFGSDRVFRHPHLLSTLYTLDHLFAFLMTLHLRPTAVERFMVALPNLMNKCPLPVTMMSDFFWWLNFTCKWQSVSLRTLSFTNLFSDGKSVDPALLANFETFFNTERFQQLSMSTTLAKWGDLPSQYNYKKAARDFLLAYANGLDEYCAKKIKVGSLAGLITQKTYSANAFGLDADGMIRATGML